MKNSFRRTARAHWKLLLFPIVVAAAIGGWYTFGAPETYRSTATLWIDNGATAGSTLNPRIAAQEAADPPANIMQTELNQLLTSVNFDLSVGNGSSLRSYLASGAQAKGFGPQALLASRSVGSVPYAVTSSIAANVSSTVEGPQVLLLSYIGPTPEVASSVLRSLISRMQGKTKQFGVDFATVQERYYARQLDYRQRDAASLEQAAAAYLRSHPSATAATDAIYAQLLDAVHSSSSKLTAPSAVIQRAAALEAGGGNPLVKVVDPPRPGAAVHGVAFKLGGIVAGAVAGLLLSVLVTVLLTPMSPVRWDLDEQAATASLVGGSSPWNRSA